MELNSGQENLSFSFYNSDKYREDAKTILKNIFGHHDFRGHQEKIIHEILDGRDVLALMPTGGGKSLCYQIPALVREGVGIVISPLISLMEDQVSTLNELGVNAAFLNSTLSITESREIRQQLKDGQIDILYLAPERLLKSGTLELLQGLTISVIAIDEAHCVSKWGPDFRPEYMKLSVLKKAFPEVPRIALTATADIDSRKQIVKELDITQARVFLSSFDRPNISYEIDLKDKDPQSQLLNFLERFDINDSGIVYCLSRRKVEETTQFLIENGFNAHGYHAGMSSSVRKAAQNEFLLEEGVIIVATIAFGMGIDKPDVRFVAHMDLPKSLESYYQETGRAGRDGLNASALMLYGKRDAAVLRHLVRKGTRDAVQRKVEEHHIDLMYGLCESTLCRRQVILHFLDERYPEYCGNCDICEGSLENEDLVDITDEMMLYLSSIYKSGQKLALDSIFKFLVGDESLRLQEFISSTHFGQGSNLSPNQWRDIHRIALASGFITVDFDRGQAIKLTQESLKVIENSEKVFMRSALSRPTVAKKTTVRKSRTRKKAKAKTKTAPKKKFIIQKTFPSLDSSEQELFKNLKDFRQRLAKKRRIPAFKVLHDITLVEMIKKRPANAQEFSDLHGVGAAKVKKYSDLFISFLEEQTF
ncbi:DNA helicase RecQ [Halobacteriovorax sp. HLS]|uniref:DNA helicase RecQ n=1 Tax=Halobacteriovorax sp. HLS TaxID=2234000 RepID=UPI000FDA5726|nr:DNA helicase RecQ [Halobacteriovorax sp. HLS]